MENILLSPSEMLNHIRNNSLSETFYKPSSAGARIGILGLPEVGKRSLYNSLWGWQVITADMPRQAVTQLGLFDLVDLPQNPQEAVEQAFYADDYEVLVYLLDARHGLRPEDFQWIVQLRAYRKPILIVLNRANFLSIEQCQQATEQLYKRLGVRVLPLDNRNQTEVHAKLLPAMLQICPDLGSDLATEIVSLRRHVAQQLIRQAVLSISTHHNSEEAPADNEAFVRTAQLQMLKQIGDIYGVTTHQPSIVTSAMLDGIMQYLTYTTKQLESDFVWIIWRVAASVITWTMGQAAIYHHDEDRIITWRKRPVVETA